MTSFDLYTAMLDTDILFPAGKRDIIIQPAVYDLYRPKWSIDVFREWMRIDRRLRQDHDPAKVLNTQEQLNAFFFDALITDYEHLISGITLPDPGDRHVVAAAIQGGCDFIVTQNLDDFPADVLNAFGIDVYSPDEFLLLLFEENEDAFLESMRALLDKFRSPPYTLEQYLRMRTRDGLVGIAAELRKRGHLLR